MLHEPIEFDGIEYISTGEAAELTGYTSDYVGQLARAEKVHSRMFGRARFVDKKEILSYKDGIEYISTSEAAKLTGYTSDYIGQLARAGKVYSRMVGRARFVDKKEVVLYKRGPSARISSSTEIGTKDRESQSKEKIVDKKLTIPEYSPVTTKYLSDDRPLMPKLVKTSEVVPIEKHQGVSQFVSATFSQSFALGFDREKILTITVGLMLIVVSTFMFRSYYIGSTNVVQDTVAMTQASVASTLSDGWSLITIGMRVFGRTVNNIFAGLFEKGELPSADLAQKPDDDLNRDALIVVPSTGSPDEDSELKDHIAESFSDEVLIFPDESGRSGIIQPVFREIEGQPFLYVLVPLGENGKKRE